MKFLFTVVFSLFFTLAAVAQVKFLDEFAKLKPSSGNSDKITCNLTDVIESRVLYEYGAVFISKNALLPEACVFADENSVTKFTELFLKPSGTSYDISNFKFSFGNFYLQKGAKKDLDKVIAKFGYRGVARRCNGSTPCTKNAELNDDWALRSYEDTKNNWKPRSLEKNKIECEIVEKTKWKDDANLRYANQKDDRPTMYKVAIPGSSQHHFGLAIDVNNDGPNKCNQDCTSELNKNFWYRTVRYDQYHFTYLGYPEEELSVHGLKRVKCKDYSETAFPYFYWIPNIPGYMGIGTWTCDDAPLDH
jgi:hypothetical protein